MNIFKMNEEIQNYHKALNGADLEICELLYKLINAEFKDVENKIWHAHPVWFINGNPIVGYDKLKNCVRLLFWSGQSFDEPKLKNEGKFKAAEIRYTEAIQVEGEDLKRWLEKARNIQWDYKNIVKRKGVLERLK